jgi:hypothetical protein
MKNYQLLAFIGVIYLVIPFSVIYLNSALDYVSIACAALVAFPSALFFYLAWINKEREVSVK